MKTRGWTAREVDERQEELADYFELRVSGRPPWQPL